MEEAPVMMFIGFVCGATAVFFGALLSVALRKVIETELKPKPAESKLVAGPFEPRPPIQRK